jgi:hypothetical protein
MGQMTYANQGNRCDYPSLKARIAAGRSVTRSLLNSDAS